eukprot:3934938-Rhodomonas_salina.2
MPAEVAAPVVHHIPTLTCSSCILCFEVSACDGMDMVQAALAVEFWQTQGVQGTGSTHLERHHDRCRGSRSSGRGTGRVHGAGSSQLGQKP